MTNPELHLTAGFDRNLIWAEGGSVRYLVAQLCAEADRPARAPLNIALAIDASASMAGEKLAAAKTAALGLVERLAPQDRLSLVSFATDVVTHLRGAVMDGPGRQQAGQAIAALDTRDMTNLSGGWFQAADCAAAVAERDPALIPRVVIVSDGQANQGITDPVALAHHAGQLRLRGVVNSTLGIGDGYDEVLLAAIAEQGGGRLHDAEHGAEIEAVLAGEIDEALAQVVEGAMLTLDLAPGLRAEALGQSAAQAGDRLTLPLGGLAAGVTRHMVVRLTCPAGRVPDSLGVRLALTARAGAAAVAASPLTCNLCFAQGSENTAQTRDPGLALLAARAWHADLVRKVAQLNRDGGEARAWLARELPHFTRYAQDLPGGPQMIAAVGLIQSRAGGRWSERTRKEMVLQTSIALREGTDHRGPGRAGWANYMLQESEG